MIILRAFRVYEDKYVCDRKIITKWENDFPFPFNIGDPNEWKEFLKTVQIKGDYLPRKGASGVPIVYEVYIWGKIKGISSKGGFASLFPGYDNDGKKLEVSKYGRIDNNTKLYNGQEDLENDSL